jgi:hypothetical protein
MMLTASSHFKIQFTSTSAKENDTSHILIGGSMTVFYRTQTSAQRLYAMRRGHSAPEERQTIGRWTTYPNTQRVSLTTTPN